MKLVLLSGGKGEKLWPLSNYSRSKQFLKVLVNEHNESESMVQRIWRQLGEANLRKSAFIATSKSQLEMIHSQLGQDIPTIVEPNRRNTFPAIALAAAYLYTIVGVRLNEVITVLPVDLFVEGHFFETLIELEKAIEQTGAEMALLGITPTQSTNQYSYIVPHKKHGHVANSFMSVETFLEEPGEDQAAALIGQNAFWNCGVCAFKLDYVINLLIEKGLPIQYEEMIKQYDKLADTSFDLEVVEQARHAVVVPYDGLWKDLGTWDQLSEEMKEHIVGKGILSEDCTNTHLINELDIPITVLGLSNVIVATSPDGILVTNKSASSRVKDAVKSIKQRPMYEERRWGSYRVLDYKKFEAGHEVLTKHISVQAGKNISYQMHFKRSEAWTITSGEGEIVLGDQLYKVKPGDVWQIPAGTRHSLRALSDVEFIEVQSGPQLVEEDVIDIFIDWEEIEQYVTS